MSFEKYTNPYTPYICIWKCVYILIQNYSRASEHLYMLKKKKKVWIPMLLKPLVSYPTRGSTHRNWTWQLTKCYWTLPYHTALCSTIFYAGTWNTYATRLLWHVESVLVRKEGSFRQKLGIGTFRMAEGKIDLMEEWTI